MDARAVRHLIPSLFERNMRIVLTEQGFTGEALENKIKELMQKDVSRLADVILAPRSN